MLSQQKSHIFSLIQKFNQNVDPDQSYTRRDDIIVITDEAHRNQYGTLALNMRNALPKASYIWSDDTGLPVNRYTEDEVESRAAEVYRLRTMKRELHEKPGPALKEDGAGR